MKKLKRKIKEEAELVSESLTNLMFYFKSYFEMANVKLAILLLFLVLNANGRVVTKEYSTQRVIDDSIVEEYQNDYLVTSIRDRANKELIVEVSKYIDSVAPSNQLSPEILVSVCQKYELDVVFVLSQALLESHFGTKGIAARTNSIFNVGTYDDGQILYRYKHPNESIEPYAQLLVKRYLVDKEISNLLEDKGYTNVNGYRFASSKRYEASLRKLMIKIDMETSINMLQTVVNMDDKTVLAFFGPEEELDNSLYLTAMK